MSKEWRTFLILWFTQGLSAVGSALTHYALIFWLTGQVFPHIEQKGSLALAMTWTSLAATLPGIVLSPALGVWVDRFSRKLTMIWMDLSQGVLLVVMITGYWFLKPNPFLWLAYLLISLMSIFDSFHSIAFTSSYVMIVHKKDLPRANGLMQTMWTATGFLAPFLAATMTSLFGSQGLSSFPVIMGIDAFTFLISAASLLFLKIPSPEREEKETQTTSIRQFWSDMYTGIQYLRQNMFLLFLLVLSFLTIFIYASEMLLPIYVKEVLSSSWKAKGWNESFAFSVLETAGFLGGTVAGMLMSWKEWYSKKVLVLSLFLSGLTMFFFGFSQTVLVSAIFMFFIMLTETIFRNQIETTWQSQVPPEKQGRVFGLKRLISYVAAPIGFVVYGWLGGQIDTNIIYTSLGLILLTISIITMTLKVLDKIKQPNIQEE
jgi:MFS family permease